MFQISNYAQKKTICVISIAITFILSSYITINADELNTITVDNIERCFMVNFPPNYNASEKLPVVIVMHRLVNEFRTFLMEAIALT